MILVGTDPVMVQMYNKLTGKPIVTVPGQNVSVKILEQLKLPMSKTEDI